MYPYLGVCEIFVPSNQFCHTDGRKFTKSSFAGIEVNLLTRAVLVFGDNRVEMRYRKSNVVNIVFYTNLEFLIRFVVLYRSGLASVYEGFQS